MGNYLKIGEHNVHFDRIGEGQPLLCLSGFGCSNYNYEFIKEKLASKYELVLIDNRGMGKSSWVKSEYTISDLADDAHAVMKSLGHEKYGVMGISMGGFIAQELISQYSENVQFLILACTTSNNSEFPTLAKLTEDAIRKSYTVNPVLRSEVVLNATVHPTLKINNLDHFNEILKLRVEHTPDMEQLLFQKRAVDVFLDKVNDLTLINCPSLIITGKEDLFVDPVSSELLNKKIPKSELVFIEESDHHFFMEKPIETASELMKFMEKSI